MYRPEPHVVHDTKLSEDWMLERLASLGRCVTHCRLGLPPSLLHEPAGTARAAVMNLAMARSFSASAKSMGEFAAVALTTNSGVLVVERPIYPAPWPSFFNRSRTWTTTG